jgi:monoamine oxidase
MAHTPLLDRLVRIARRVHASAASPDLGRRRLLGAMQAAATVATVAVPLGSTRSARAATPKAAPRIAVVGAGLAGLTAAWSLNRAGFGPAVFEASGRLGGRCWSERGVFDEGQVAERGGEFIDTAHTDAIALVKALGLSLDDVLAAQAPETDSITWIDGAPYTADEADRDFAAIAPIVRRQAASVGEPSWKRSNKAARSLDQMSIAQWIDRHVPGGRASKLGRALSMAYTEEMAAEPEQLSALVLVGALAEAKSDHYGAYEGSDQRYHVRGGNDRIATTLAAGLGPAAIRLNHRLTQVAKQRDGRIELVFAAGTAEVREVFDRVILALPFSTLRDVDLARAGMRPLKLRAIREAQMGRSTKLQLQFGRRFWVDAGSDGLVAMERASFHSTWEVSRAQPGVAGILNFWSGGDIASAVADGTDADAAGRALADIDAVLPGARSHWNGLVTRNVWEREPFARGSYMAPPPGWYTTFGGIEREPEGRVHFAGEHTAAESQGYLNGAIESGRRAAREVASAFGGRVPLLPAA